MKKVLKIAAIVFIALVELMLIGCATFPEYVFPAYIDEDAKAYVGEDTNTPRLLPWTTLHDGEVLERKMNFHHLMNQLSFQFMIDDEQTRYNYVSNAQSTYNQNSRQGMEEAFSTTGPFGILAAGLIGSVAWFIPTPGQRKREDEAEERGRRKANGGNNT